MSAIDFDNSQLDFEVEKVPYFYNSDGTQIVSEKVSSLIRKDNGKELGYCGKRYTPIQNKVVFDFVSKLFENETEIEEVHSFEDGATNMIFSNVLSDLEFTQENDRVEKRIFATFQHTAGFSVKFGISEQVISCANVFPFLMKKSNFRVTHDSLYNTKLDAGKQLFANIRKENEEVNQFYQELVENELGNYSSDYTDGIIKSVLDIPQKTKIDDLSTRTKNKINAMVGSVERELASKGNNFWGLFNGITYYVNHVSNEAKELSNEQKMFKLHYGSENYLMQRALLYCRNLITEIKNS